MALYLTFFLTSLRINELYKQVDSIAVNDTLKTMGASGSPSGIAAYMTAKSGISRMNELYTTGQAELGDWEAIEFLTEMLTEERRFHDSLEVSAVSLDLSEFAPDAPAVVLGYEGVLCTIAKRGRVERTYLLSDSEWTALLSIRQWLKTEGAANPRAIPDRLDSIGLTAIARHFRCGIVCRAVRDSDVPNELKQKSDLIIISHPRAEGREFICGANRRKNEGIHVRLKSRAYDIERWFSIIEGFKFGYNAIKLPPFQNPAQISERKE